MIANGTTKPNIFVPSDCCAPLHSRFCRMKKFENKFDVHRCLLVCGCWRKRGSIGHLIIDSPCVMSSGLIPRGVPNSFMTGFSVARNWHVVVQTIDANDGAIFYWYRLTCANMNNAITNVWSGSCSPRLAILVSSSWKFIYLSFCWHLCRLYIVLYFDSCRGWWVIRISTR